MYIEYGLQSISIYVTMDSTKSVECIKKHAIYNQPEYSYLYAHYVWISNENNARHVIQTGVLNQYGTHGIKL